MALTLDQSKNILNTHKESLRTNYNVEKIGVFGSVASSSNTDKSDVDILVELSEPIGFFKFIELEEYLGSILGKKVDLVTSKALKPYVKEEILKEVVYA
jgi:uncharacterized protein